ncbi:DUF1326 domain-containing protein [Desulfosediminicola sp.]|uniref:DUF1326 domain-containing protein n=1 Tax=Desulfosediminicola sp. TaxID=2886825 RepID=UPI003AF20E77
MKSKNYSLFIGILAAAFILLGPLQSSGAEAEKWHFNGTVIEACSCPMFCQCYFNTEPALHQTEDGAKHFCKFNMAYKVNKGHYGETDLAGVKFWVAGDLGETWKDGETDWAILTFQIGTTDDQKEAIKVILGNVFPVKWQSFEVMADTTVEWVASEQRAEAKLAGGENAHIILNSWQGMEDHSAMLTNIAYFGAPRNSGFKMMPNEIETWKVGDKAFEFKGTTGFMITIDMTSEDLSI